jgi:hypothetical protein
LRLSLPLLACLLFAGPALGIDTPSVAPVQKPSAAQAPVKPLVKKVANKRPATRLATNESSAGSSTAAAPSAATPAEAPSAAPEAPPAQSPSLSDLGNSLRNYFTEDESKVLYEFMKDTLVSSLKGTEATTSLPPDLAFKMEVLIARMKREGGAYMDQLSQELDAEMKKRNTLPPPVEYIPSRPWPEKNPWLTR